VPVAETFFDKRMTGGSPDTNERNAEGERMGTGGNGSSGPKSPLMFLKPVDKRGSELADRLVMTISQLKALISIREFARFCASGRFLSNKAKGTRAGSNVMTVRLPGSQIGSYAQILRRHS